VTPGSKISIVDVVPAAAVRLPDIAGEPLNASVPPASTIGLVGVEPTTSVPPVVDRGRAAAERCGAGRGEVFRRSR